MKKDSLESKYKDDVAKKYDDRRQNTPRGRAEARAMDSLIGYVQPASLLDCPCGTGRFFPIYEKHGVTNITGIDVSNEMLAQAREKISRPTTTLILHEGNVHDRKFMSALEKHDLAVCMRFFNWLEFRQVSQVFKSLVSRASSALVVGFTVGEESPPDNRRRRFPLSPFGQRSAQRPVPIVHSEIRVQELFAAHGLAVERREETFRRSDRVNYMYLLTT